MVDSSAIVRPVQLGFELAEQIRVHLRGDWQSPCTFAPNFFAGYALYDLVRSGA